MLQQSNADGDSRLTKIIAWIAGIGGTLTVALLVWIGASLVDLKIAVASLQERSAPVAQQVQALDSKTDRIEARVNAIDLRLTTIEARQLKALQ